MMTFSSSDRSDERRTSRAGTWRVPVALLLGFALVAALGIRPETVRATDVLLPYGSPDFRYSTQPYDELSGFEQPGFDDSDFIVGAAAFGYVSPEVNCPLDSTVATQWTSGTDLLVRRTFDVPADLTGLEVAVAIDDQVQVFVNGIDISGGLRTNENCAARDAFVFPIPDTALVPGTNLLAIRARDLGGSDYLDVEIRATPATTTVTLSASASKVDYQHSVRLTAHLTAYQETINKSVSIYKTPYGGTKTLVTSGTVNADGNLSASVVMSKKTVFVAQFAGDAKYLAAKSNAVTVQVYPQVTGRLSGQYGSSGPYKLYHYSATCPNEGRRCPTYTASVAPNHQGKYVYFTLQLYRNGAWRTALSSRYRLDSQSKRTVIFVYSTRDVIGIRSRVHVEFRGDADHLAKTSPWSYFKVTT